MHKVEELNRANTLSSNETLKFLVESQFCLTGFIWTNNLLMNADIEEKIKLLDEATRIYLCNVIIVCVGAQNICQKTMR